MAGGERESTARMAKKVADEVFPVFGWRQVGGVNENFGCTSPEEHRTDNHPADVVLTYDDPYTRGAVYVHFDLKSYASDTLNNSRVRAALESASRTTACANRSEEWRDRYTDRSRGAECIGALFIYNHDAGYDRNFADVLQSVGSRALGIPPNQRVVVFGPEDVCYLASVAKDIKALRDPDSRPWPLPSRDDCFFWQPHLQKFKATDPCWKSATVENLTGPYLTVGFRRQTVPQEGYLIYYRHGGETVDEFLYLFDYLFKFQLLKQAVKVQIRMPFPGRTTAHVFEAAKRDYASLYAHFSEVSEMLTERLTNVELGIVDVLHPQQSYVEIGGL